MTAEVFDDGDDESPAWTLDVPSTPAPSAPTISRIIATRAKIVTGHAKIAMIAAPAAADVQLARCSMPYGSLRSPGTR